MSGCQLRAGEKKRPKLLPEKLLRPADNPPNLPSVQNNRFLLSGILHFFPFSGKSPEFCCRTIYGTLYYLPHLHHILKKRKKTQSLQFCNFFGSNSCGSDIKYYQQYVRICQNIVIKEKRSNTRNTASNAICDAMSEWDPATFNLVILLHISSHTVHLI